MKTLKLAKDLSFPLDAVTQTYLIVGKRGSGKSNTAARMAEQLHRAGIPFVVLDPVDTWWGLKASRDGTGPGLAGVYVFGGSHADLPLEADGGKLVAELLCEHKLSMVLSVKHLSGRARSAFMVAFAQTLFQKWSGGVLHVILEEAHELAPQNSMNAREGEQEMLGAFKRLWKLGRSTGIGGSALTQRAASLSKDITTQSEILIAHRTIGPQDVAAVGEWIKYHHGRSDILGELPSLPTGDAFVWSPEFPEDKPIGLKRVSMLLRETYDSASTPKVGEQRIEPKVLAAVDLERLRAKMAATIERSNEEDPKLLQKRIRELERERERAPQASDPPALIEQLQVEAKEEYARGYADGVAAGVDAERAEWKDLVAGIHRVHRLIETATQDFDAMHLSMAAQLDGTRSSTPGMDALERFVTRGANAQRAVDVAIAKSARSSVPSPRPKATRDQRDFAIGERLMQPPASNGNGTISGTAQRILDAIAFYETVGGTATPTKKAVAAFVGVSSKTGSWTNRLSELRTAGLIEDPSDRDRIALSSAGRERADTSSIPRSRAELHQRWLTKLGGTSARILAVLLDVFPDAIEKSALAAHVGVSPETGSWTNRLSELRVPGLLEDVSKSEVRAAQTLFPKGLR